MFLELLFLIIVSVVSYNIGRASVQNKPIPEWSRVASVSSIH